MAQQKSSKNSPKRYLIVVFVLVGSLLIMADVGKNIADDIRITSELETLSAAPVEPRSKINPTLSEEEMKEWTQRLKTHSDT